MTPSAKKPAAARQTTRVAALVASLLALLLIGQCANTDVDEPQCEGGSYRCVGSVSMRCTDDGAGWTVESDCSTLDLICTSHGCKKCEPNSTYCQGQDLVRCNEDGSDYLPQPILTCDGDQGMMCDGDGCTNACELAEENRSYVGCEYWAVDLDNAVVQSGNAAAQQFAIALSNPSSLTAKVTVEINNAPYGETPAMETVTERTVGPSSLELILLPAREVDGSPAGQYNTGGGTAVTSNAYRITSNAPLIVYQFNPLSNAGVFSNDASLLIPTSALTGGLPDSGAAYTVMAWPQTIASSDDPGSNFGVDLRTFLTIVGTREETKVRVQLSTDIVGDDSGLIGAKKAGELVDFTLGPFDVLNLESTGFGADFTSSRIETNKPVAVFSGSEASDVPDFRSLTTRECCADHLEQQLFPQPTLGTTFIALTSPSRSQALQEAGAVITPRTETEYFRILATGEFSTVATNLPPPNDLLRFDEKPFQQLAVQQDFTIQGSDALVVGQFIASQQAAGIPSSLPGGDPSFILLPPVEQFRREYLFLTPDKYAFDFVMIAAPQGAKVTLDGRLLQEGEVPGPGLPLRCSYSTVGSVMRPNETVETTYVAYKCQLSFPQLDPTQTPPKNLLPGQQNDGVHRLSADQPVGLVVYGFDSYVSYGYPGGTDMTLINIK